MTIRDHCFGDDDTRGGLRLQTRTLPHLTMLGSLGECEPQLAERADGKLVAGSDRGVLVRTVTPMLSLIGHPRALNALRIVNKGTSP